MNAKKTDKAKPSRLRQYLLGGVMLVMASYFGGTWLLNHWIQGPLEAAKRETAQRRKQIKDLESGLAKLREAGKMLEVWEQQSLPENAEVARSLYQAWLVELVEDIELTNPSVTSSEPTTRRGLYHSLSFSVRGRGTLEQLTRFLFAFYQTDLLHTVRTLSITPMQRSEQLDLSLSIEALALIGGSNAMAGSSQESIFEEFRRRTWRASERLAVPDVDTYWTSIVRRNVFGMGGTPDPTDSAFLTSINQIDGQPEVWFTLRATNELIKLRTGERLQVGPLSLEIAEVLGPDVILRVDDERWLLTLGDRLTDAYALPPEH
jgi:hypothetical protein